MTADPAVQRRKEELVAEARITLEAIRSLAAPGVEDPWTDAATLAKAVPSGLLDAPQLKNNRFARGEIRTQIINGMCLAVDERGRPLSEHDSNIDNSKGEYMNPPEELYGHRRRAWRQGHGGPPGVDGIESDAL